MINVGDIVLSPEFAQTFTVYRETGSWQSGKWVANPETSLAMYGTVTAASPNDLQQLPEGDRVVGMMCFYSPDPIYETHSGNANVVDGTSDQILWNEDRYRVYSVMPWKDYGYYKALAVRMVGK